MLRIKETKKLFYGEYQYKIVLVCSGSYLFRYSSLDTVYNLLQAHQRQSKIEECNIFNPYRPLRLKSQKEIDYCFKIYDVLSSIDDYKLRIEHPYLSVYSNNKDHIDLLANLDINLVKYMCVPYVSLEKGVIVMTDTPFEFKVTVSPSRLNHSAFVEWAESNKNVKLTPHCKYKLSQNNRYNETYFYITGEKNLLLAKMHLAGDMHRIEKIINRVQSEKV